MSRKLQQVLNLSSGGLPILVSSTDLANPVKIHRVYKSIEDFDELFVYASNAHNDTVEAQIVATRYDQADQVISRVTISKLSLPANVGLYLTLPGLIYQDNQTDDESYVDIEVIASVEDVISISGWYNIVDNGKQTRIPNI